jgi:hypothetical protein
MVILVRHPYGLRENEECWREQEEVKKRMW